MAAGNRVHYYHADACAFGGYFRRPIEHVIAPQAPMSLPPSGGYGFARAENFRIEGLVSFKSAFTQVSGHLSKKDRGGWVTLVTAVVEGFNALDIVTADRLCAQISTEHPLEGDNPKVTFLGTSFDNLKIAGYPIKVTLDFRICDQGNGDGYPDEPCVADKGFLKRVGEQYRQMNNAGKMPDWVKDRTIPDFIKERYQDGQVGKSGAVVSSVVRAASVVKEPDETFPGRPFGNVFEVPNFGRVFLGELLVDCKSYQLTMVRLELGCSADGQNSTASSKANGGTYPP
jgi:hypothetical protein